jgi:AmmeMemoRadiSam system protein A/AmmeMemoRadiSam system protein B
LRFYAAAEKADETKTERGVFMGITGAFILPHPPLISPEIGRGRERSIQSSIDSFHEIAAWIGRLAPDTIVVTTPHSVMYADYFHISPGYSASGDFQRFGAGNVRVHVEYDAAFVAALSENAVKAGLSAGSLGEKDAALDHGVMIPLRFINARHTDYKLVRVSLSGLPYTDHYQLGQCIAQTAADLNKNVVLIASGDLSHKLKPDAPYGFAAEGPAFDKRVTEAMRSGDFMEFLSIDPSFAEKAAECGLRSFIIMAGALDAKTVASKLLSYEGPFGVGYAAASFIPGGQDASRRYLHAHSISERLKMQDIKDHEDEYVRLARYALESWIQWKQRPKLPQILPREMREHRAGVFVSLKKHGMLRGCIGTIAPVTDCIAEEIMRNALDAALHDPRFDPVTGAELDQLVYSVDVLAPAEPIASPDQLDVKRYGVIVSSGSRRGLLLPNLDGVDTTAQQISIALQKAGIRPGEEYRLARFEVVRHK